jgi:hypothetical protein
VVFIHTIGEAWAASLVKDGKQPDFYEEVEKTLWLCEETSRKEL